MFPVMSERVISFWLPWPKHDIRSGCRWLRQTLVGRADARVSEELMLHRRYLIAKEGVSYHA